MEDRGGMVNYKRWEVFGCEFWAERVSYFYHHPRKRLNRLKGFTGCLWKLTVKTFTGQFSGNYDLVLLLLVMNFERVARCF
ncbi:MAG: hypothetical protein Q8J64_00480, partial [Thermodesulfovibrionales bacterium]|nr:hypothetical protein [Thermodesulfovibrionales bacterium]